MQFMSPYINIKKQYSIPLGDAHHSNYIEYIKKYNKDFPENEADNLEPLH